MILPSKIARSGTSHYILDKSLHIVIPGASMGERTGSSSLILVASRSCLCLSWYTSIARHPSWNNCLCSDGGSRHIGGENLPGLRVSTLFRKPRSGAISAHFIVEKDGSVSLLLLSCWSVTLAFCATRASTTVASGWLAIVSIQPSGSGMSSIISRMSSSVRFLLMMSVRR